MNEQNDRPVGTQCLSYRALFVPEVVTVASFVDRHSYQGFATFKAWPAPKASDELPTPVLRLKYHPFVSRKSEICGS
jgi:hypothetical protein